MVAVGAAEATPRRTAAAVKNFIFKKNVRFELNERLAISKERVAKTAPV